MSDPTVGDRADGEGTPPAPLSVETDLTLTVEGREASVRSTGDRLFVEFGSLADALGALGASDATDPRLARIDRVLETTDLTVEVRVRDRTVAVLGAAARPGVVSRRLGVAPVELRLGGALGAVGRELSAARATLARALR